MLPRGGPLPILGIIVLPISDVTFLMNFGSRQALPGGHQPMPGGYLPAGVFINILAQNSDITMCF